MPYQGAMSDGLRIRPASRADAGAIAAISAPAIRNGEAFDLPRDLADPEIVAYWMTGGKTAFIAEEAGRAVGVSYLRANPGGTCDVANAGYATHPDHLGRGVARAVPAFARRSARPRLSRHAVQFRGLDERERRASVARVRV
jgi:GNAT superfamily N-acetyltransferase